MPGFASDNTSGVHPRVLEAIAAVNTDHVPAYGDDVHTARVNERLRAAFDADAEVLFCFGGTGANVTALARAGGGPNNDVTKVWVWLQFDY